MTSDEIFVLVLGLILNGASLLLFKSEIIRFVKQRMKKIETKEEHLEWFERIPKEKLYFWMKDDTLLENDSADIARCRSINGNENMWKDPDQKYLLFVCPKGLDQIELSADLFAHGYCYSFKTYIRQVNSFLLSCNEIKQMRLRNLCLNLKNDIKVTNETEFVYWALVINVIIRPYPELIKKYSEIYVKFIENSTTVSTYFPLTTKLR